MNELSYSIALEASFCDYITQGGSLNDRSVWYRWNRYTGALCGIEDDISSQVSKEKCDNVDLWWEIPL